MQKIITFLWFESQAEEAMNHYVSVFKNSKVLSVHRTPAGGPGPEGAVLTCSFQLEGQEFMALNGGPEFKFTPAISLYVDCKDQAEVDELWSKLSASPQDEQCGWLKDKFGLSWQIIPEALTRLMWDSDPARAGAVMQAMMQMKKIDVAALQRAYDGG